MSNKNKLLAGIVFLIITISIAAGVVLVNQKQVFTEKAAPTTNLTFNPTSLSVVSGQSFSTNVKVSTGANLVTGIDVEITFNPSVIQLTQLTPTSAISSLTSVNTGQVIKNEIDNTLGVARFIAYTVDKNLGVSGQQDILFISGKLLTNVSPNNYQLAFGQQTSIAALNENQNAVLSKSPMTITALPADSSTYPNWDIDQNGTTNIIDIGLVVDDYDNPNPKNVRSDVDRNGSVDIIDIGLIVDHYGESTQSGASPVPTVRPSATPRVTAAPTAAPTATDPPISPTTGIWISPSEIMALPTSGAAWTRVQTAANSSWGSANLSDNNSMHDVNTLAGALVAVRTGNSAMRSKTIAGLQSAMNSPLSRALELSRGLQTYVIAADIIGYRTPEFEAWVREMLNKDVSAHTGGSQLCNSSGVELSCSGLGGVVCTALRSANNWGGHARASAIASALYLNDRPLLTKLINAHKAFIGLDVPNNLYCENTNWHADSNNKYGVNKLGTTISGHSVSGVLPEDWRRGSEFSWPPTLSGYMWEGMQGYVVSAVMLQRSGDLAFSAGDNSVVRAMNMLYTGINNPASSDDTWIPWVVNYYANTNFPTGTAVAGKNMGWTDWTHQK